MAVVLDQVVTSQLGNLSMPSIANVGSALHNSSLLSTTKRHENRFIVDAIELESNRHAEYLPFDGAMSSGIVALLQLVKRPPFTKRVFETLGTSLERIAAAPKLTSLSAVDLTNSMLHILQATVDLGHNEQIPPPLTVPFNVPEWIAVCSEMVKTEPLPDLLKYVRPKATPTEVSNALEEAANKGEFNAQHTATIRVSDVWGIPKQWRALSHTIGQRLDAGTDSHCAQVRELLSALWELSRANHQEAKNVINNLAKTGHILHYLHKASGEPNSGCAADCAYTFLQVCKTVEKPQVAGKSDAGFNTLIKKYLTASDQEFCAAFYKLVRAECPNLWLFEFIDARSTVDPLIALCLKRIVDEGLSAKYFTAGGLLKRWTEFRQVLNDNEQPKRFSRLVESLSRESDLVPQLQADPFSVDKVELYSAASQEGDGKQTDFNDWCRRGLGEFQRDAWKSDFKRGFHSARLALRLAEYGTPVLTGAVFADAVEDYAREVAKSGTLPPEDVAGQWDRLLDSISDNATRRVLTARIIDAAVEANGKVTGSFFTLFGKDLTSVDALTSNNRIVSHFFSPIVRDRNLSGLKWLQDLLAKDNTLLNRVVSADTVQDFKNRLRECVHNSLDTEEDRLIHSIAKSLDIHPQDNAPADSKS